jgi:hypothetical protein
LFGKGLFDRGGDKRGFEDPLIRCFGGTMSFDRFGADSFFGEEFHGRAEEVMKEPPFMFVELVEQRNDLRII